MKSKFLNYARNVILGEYMECAKRLGWKMGGQDLISLSHLKTYISTSTWNEQLQKDLHLLQYKRFKIDIQLHCWDYKLSDRFCEMNNTRFTAEDTNEKCARENNQIRGGKIMFCYTGNKFKE